MKVPRVVKAMEYIDDDLITAAATYAPKKKKPVWLKWGAMAACLCLMVMVAIPIINHFNQPAEQPLGQGYFNAIVLEVLDDSILAECTENNFKEISVGATVKISTTTISSEAVPKVEVGDNIRVLYIGEVTDTDPVTFSNTISIFLLDENGEPIVETKD